MKWSTSFDDPEPIPFYFYAPVKLLGAYITGRNALGDTVAFEMYLGGSLMWTSRAHVVTSTPTYLASGYAGDVDEVRVLKNAFSTIDAVSYFAPCPSRRRQH